MVKKLKLQSLQFVGNGDLRPVELPGPPTYENWERSYVILRGALIMVDAVSLGRLDAYMQKIKTYNTKFVGCWPLIYEAD
eukprot:5559647-Amphidinium_carterae.1